MTEDTVIDDIGNLKTEHWAVVGGGMLGLALALRLAKAGQAVTLYESAPVLGGLASAWQLGDVEWDRHYHVTLLSDTVLRDMLQELDLGKRNSLGRDQNWFLYRRQALLDVE